MEIQKLKKSILEEEALRRDPHRLRNRRIALALLVLLLATGVLYFWFQRDNILQARYDKSLALLDEGFYREAARMLKAVHETHPESTLAPRALFQAGEIYHFYLGRYPEALLAYFTLLRDYPDDPLAASSLRQIATIYKYRLQDDSQAIVAYQRLLDLGAAGGDEIQYEVADAYFRLNNFEQARIEFERLLEDYPASPRVPEVHYRIGVCYFLEENLPAAQAILEEMITTWPESPIATEARFALAGVLEEQEELRKALDLLNELEGVYPNAEALAKKQDQLQDRIQRKKKAI